MQRFFAPNPRNIRAFIRLCRWDALYRLRKNSIGRGAGDLTPHNANRISPALAPEGCVGRSIPPHPHTSGAQFHLPISSKSLRLSRIGIPYVNRCVNKAGEFQHVLSWF